MQKNPLRTHWFSGIRVSKPNRILSYALLLTGLRDQVSERRRGELFLRRKKFMHLTEFRMIFFFTVLDFIDAT